MSQDVERTLGLISRKMDHLRAAVLLQAIGPDRILDLNVFDHPIRMYLPYAATDMIQRQILLSGSLYEAGQLFRIKKEIAPGSVIVDAGANIGNHTLFFAIVCRAERVHAFEPLRITHSILQKNILINGLSNVTTHNMALGAREGSCALFSFGAENTGSSSFDMATGQDYAVTTIDAMNFERIDFIKIDVEGNQIPFLEGAQQTLRRLRPRIWIELHRKKGEYEPADTALRDLGYRQQYALSESDFVYAPA